MRPVYIDAKGVRVEVHSIEDGQVRFYPQGGGFPHSLPAEEFYDAFKVAPALTWKLSRVGIDSAAGPFECYLNERRWNGWRCPVFTFEQLGPVLASLPNELHFDPKTREVLETIYDEPDNEVVKVNAEFIHVDGRPVIVWGVGDGWCWEEV